MRQNLPPKKTRQKLHRLLVGFFRNENPDGYTLWLREICAYYRLKKPKTKWVSSASLKADAARTWDNGEIHLMRPEVWCAMPEKYNRTMKEWLTAVNHEFYHYLHWVNDEDKADEFAAKMLKGL